MPCLLFQLVHRGVGLQIGAGGFLGEGLQSVNGARGLADDGVVIGCQGGHIRIDNRLGSGIFSRRQGDSQIAPGLTDDIITAAAIGAQSNDDLPEGVVVAIGLVDEHRFAIRAGDDRGQVLVGAEAGGRVGVAVTADDGIDAGHRAARLVSTLASISTEAGFSVKPMWVKARTTSFAARKSGTNSAALRSGSLKVRPGILLGSS